MKLTISRLAVLAVLFIAAPAWPQNPGAKQSAQQKAEELKQAVAANRVKLEKYQWVETTTVSVKGEVKKQGQEQCYYGADGTIQKTPIGTPAPSSAPERGLKGRIIAKKKAEAKDETEQLKELVSLYAPPNPQQLQRAAQAGKADLEIPSAGGASVIFTDYAKPGDKVTFTFDTAAKKIQSYTVNTYQDNPKDIVTMAVNFASLEDGTNYVQQTVLNSTSKQIQIKTMNSGYRPLTP